MQERSSAARAGEKKALIVEDDFIIALDLAHMMRSIGFLALGPCATVADALARLLDDGTAERPDVILLDVDLGGQRSTPVAEASRARGIPYVVVTGYSPQDLVEPALQHAPCLAKPVNADWLGAVLDKLVGGRDA
jgi:CheY-like chemotaxis protein